jgi:hypothetical protein
MEDIVPRLKQQGSKIEQVNDKIELATLRVDRSRRTSEEVVVNSQLFATRWITICRCIGSGRGDSRAGAATVFRNGAGLAEQSGCYSKQQCDTRQNFL